MVWLKIQSLATLGLQDPLGLDSCFLWPAEVEPTLLRVSWTLDDIPLKPIAATVWNEGRDVEHDHQGVSARRNERSGSNTFTPDPSTRASP
jgi:hypothetical protein